MIFHSAKDHSVSPAVYLHSHAGLVLNFLEGALPRMRTGDAGYSCARVHRDLSRRDSGKRKPRRFQRARDRRRPAERDKPAAYDRLMAAARKFDWGDRGIFLVDVDRWRVEHAGSAGCAYGDIGDGFGLQEATTLTSVAGVVQLPAAKAGT